MVNAAIVQDVIDSDRVRHIVPYSTHFVTDEKTADEKTADGTKDEIFTLGDVV